MSTGALSQVPAEHAFAELKDEEFISDEEAAHSAILGAFGRRTSEGVVVALQQVISLGTGTDEVKKMSRARALIVARRILAAFPDESVPRLLELYARGDAATKGLLIQAAGKVSGGDRVTSFLRAALDNQSVCEEEGADALGEPLRVCDLAYNQLVLRSGVKRVLRTISPTHSLAVRDYHISLLQAKL
jgi:hypothetical protein